MKVGLAQHSVNITSLPPAASSPHTSASSSSFYLLLHQRITTPASPSPLLFTLHTYLASSFPNYLYHHTSYRQHRSPSSLHTFITPIPTFLAKHTTLPASRPSPPNPTLVPLSISHTVTIHTPTCPTYQPCSITLQPPTMPLLFLYSLTITSF